MYIYIYYKYLNQYIYTYIYIYLYSILVAGFEKLFPWCAVPRLRKLKPCLTSTITPFYLSNAE